MTEQEQRQAVVAEVRSWIGTPWHHMGTVKGAGVDCGQLLIRTFVNTGLVADFKTGQYPHDWHMHRSEERYLGHVQQHMTLLGEIEKPTKEQWAEYASPVPPLPGDVLVWRWGRTFSHGAIVTEWPFVVHAHFNARMVLEDNLLLHPLVACDAKHFSYWGR